MNKQIECDGCKWWSKIIAGTDDNGALRAMCLNPNAYKYYQRMVMAGCNRRRLGIAMDATVPGVESEA